MNIKQYNEILRKNGIWSQDYIRPTTSKHRVALNEDGDAFIKWKEIPFSSLGIDPDKIGLGDDGNMYGMTCFHGKNPFTSYIWRKTYKQKQVRR